VENLKKEKGEVEEGTEKIQEGDVDEVMEDGDQRDDVQKPEGGK